MEYQSIRQLFSVQHTQQHTTRTHWNSTLQQNTATTHCNNTLQQHTATKHCNITLQQHTATTLCNNTKWSIGVGVIFSEFTGNLAEGSSCPGSIAENPLFFFGKKNVLQS